MKLFQLSVLFFCLISCSAAGPKVTYVFKYGKFCKKMTTYNYPDGVKTKMSQLIYANGDLMKETVFTERWPNDEYYLISEKGFVVYENDEYVFNIDSIAKPDNLIYEYYTKDYVPVIEVYKNGVREPYLLGYPDGHRTMQYLRNPPGVYNWKDGVEYYERPFTEEEWGSHERMNEYLNSEEFKANLPDSLKSK